MAFFKNLLFSCFILVFYSNILWAQCPQGAVFFFNQADVDIFPVLYPDCTEIAGELYIYGSGADIADLSPLNQITAVGSLSILENPVLTSLSGLDNLTTVVRAVAIRDNDALLDLGGLDNLTTIGEFLHITQNDNLINLNGLSSLTSISWNLRIGFNENLLNLDGLDNLTSIGDNFSLTEDLRIDNNPMLSICSVPSICYFLENGGSNAIYFNASGCNNLTEVSDACTVSIETFGNSFNFNVLPNPNKGTFVLQGIPEGTYQILNTSGQIIRQGDMRNHLLIDISSEAQGVYFISVIVDDAILVRRVVKM